MPETFLPSQRKEITARSRGSYLEEERRSEKSETESYAMCIGCEEGNKKILVVAQFFKLDFIRRGLLLVKKAERMNAKNVPLLQARPIFVQTAYIRPRPTSGDDNDVLDRECIFDIE